MKKTLSESIRQFFPMWVPLTRDSVPKPAASIAPTAASRTASSYGEPKSGTQNMAVAVSTAAAPAVTMLLFGTGERRLRANAAPEEK